LENLHVYIWFCGISSASFVPLVNDTQNQSSRRGLSSANFSELSVTSVNWWIFTSELCHCRSDIQRLEFSSPFFPLVFPGLSQIFNFFWRIFFLGGGGALGTPLPKERTRNFKSPQLSKLPTRLLNDEKVVKQSDSSMSPLALWQITQKHYAGFCSKLPQLYVDFLFNKRTIVSLADSVPHKL